MKVLQIYNYASHYRGPIYRMLDETLNSDFVVGDLKTDVKEVDLTTFKHDVRKYKVHSFKGVLYMKEKPRLIKENYDIYLFGAEIRDISLWLFLFLKVLFYHNKKVYGWTHGMLGKESRFKQILYKLFYKMMNGVFVYNERSRQLLIEKGVPSTKLFTIYNSLDYDRQLPIRLSLKETPLFINHFHNDSYNIVFIGRLTKKKRFDLLIDAVSILKQQGKYVNVTFIGDGIERRNIERRVQELGLESQVWFYGACFDEKTNAELIFNADLCVSPGNIGLTAIHVLMFGCPAITNDDFDHQMPEFEAIHDGITGTFFKVGDPNSLAESINNWFTYHNNDRDQVRKACYDEIDTKWNPHHQMKIFKDVLFN